MRLKRAILAICVIIFAVLFANGVSILNAAFKKDNEKYRYNRMDSYENNYIGDNDSNVNMLRIQEESSIMNEPAVNLLVLGLDEYEERADSIIILNYSPDAVKLNILSIARDTRVFVDGKPVKINSLIAMGGEQKMIDIIEKITGLNINYYITLNFEGFRKIIDTLGGVRVNVPFNMNYDDPTQNLHIHLRKGVQILNGREAEQYVRFRKGNNDRQGYADGDLGRIKAQQEFIKSFIEQKLKLKYITKVDDIFLILRKYMRTNIKLGDIKHYIGSVKNLRNEDINAYTIPGRAKYIDGQSYFIINRSEVKRLIDEKFYK
ncbi:MAG TPA: LCP family protein [Clostridiaceae bacterium]|nr:LCP family protein [Clostridiaceae bacterium]